MPELSISLENVCFVVFKAREFDAKDVVTEPEVGSNGADDDMASVLEDHGDDPVRGEIVSFIRSLSTDQQVDLVALTWLGRGDGGIDDWDSLRAEAARAHNNRTATYLLGEPLLGDFLAEGLAAFGLSCADVERTTPSSD